MKNILKFTRSQISKKYGISKYMWNSKHDEVMAYLSEYMDIKEYCPKGCFYYIIEDAPDEIPSLKGRSRAQKEADYRKFVINNLSEEFELNSKIRMAEKAKREFAQEKYHHTNAKYIASNFVGPVMEEEGECTVEYYWCMKNLGETEYELMSDEILDDWFSILSDWHFTALEVENAMIDSVQEDSLEPVEKKLDAYRGALADFSMKHDGKVVVHLKMWRKKKKDEKNVN